MKVKTNVAIIGAGYYGCYAAYKLSVMYPHLKFVLIEKESEICTKASSTNQGQLHKGYMYTAKPKLVFECSEYAKVFEQEFPTAINKQVHSYYGLHKKSLISQSEFEKICSKADLTLKKIDKNELFGNDVVAAYETTESTINTHEMRKIMAKNLFQKNIEIFKSTTVNNIEKIGDKIDLACSDKLTIESDIVINATFASVNALHADSSIASIPTRNDVFLHFMIDLPKKYKNIAATVAVGNYCSLMPSSFRGTHLLAVGGIRSIANSIDTAPNEQASAKLARELFNTCIEQSSEWLPFLSKGKLCGFTVGTRTEYRDPDTGKSLSEVKVIQDHDGIENYTVLLGGKISCLSECIEPLSKEIDRAVYKSFSLLAA